MIDHLGLIVRKQLHKSPGITHRSYLYLKVQIRMITHKLLLDLISIVFVHIKDDQLLGRMSCHLTAQFRSYRSAAARYQYHLIIDKVVDLLHINPDLFAAQQVFNGYVLQIVYRDPVLIHYLIHAAQHLKRAVCLLADIEYLLKIIRSGRRYGDIDLFDMMTAYILKYAVTAAGYGNAVNRTFPFIFIIIDNDCYTVVAVAEARHLAYDSPSCGSCSY